MWSSHTQKSLDPQSDGQVEACFGIFEVDAADLADAIEPVTERVRVDPETRRRLLLLARLQIRPQRRHQAALLRPVVLHERPQVAATVVDEAFIGHGGEQSGEPELRYRDDLAPALETGEGIHDRDHLALRRRDSAGRIGRPAEADRHREARLPVRNRLANLDAKRVTARLVIAGFGA